MSVLEWSPVVTLPMPYTVAATENVNARDAIRFHRANGGP